MENSNFKRYFQFFLVVLAAGSIYPIIYLKQSYQQTILSVFNISLTQLNSIYVVLGLVFVIGYFPSGILADKFSAKKLLIISLFATGLGGLWFAQVPSYSNVLIIFAIWGIFSVFTFWAAHLKVVKLLAKQEEEGRFFGILDGGRGAVEAILASIGAFIFSMTLGGNSDAVIEKTALVRVIYMYSILLIVMAVLVAIFVETDKVVKKSEKTSSVNEKNKFKISDVLTVLKNPSVIILGGVIFMGYIVTWTEYYFGGFLQTNIKIDAATVGTVMAIVLWMRPVGGILGGFFADRLGKANILSLACSLAIIFLILLSILPVTTSPIIFYIIVILGGLFIYAIRGTYWSLMGDCKIDNKILGVGIGVVSLLGYLPDILIPIVNTHLFSTFGDNGGYNAYFIWSSVMGIIGVGLIFLFKKVTKKQVSINKSTDMLEAE